jgi:hypothetical protein
LSHGQAHTISGNKAQTFFLKRRTLRGIKYSEASFKFRLPTW